MIRPLDALVNALTWAYQLVLDVSGCDLVRFRRVFLTVFIASTAYPTYHYTPPFQSAWFDLGVALLFAAAGNPRWSWGLRRDRTDRADQRAGRLASVNGRALRSRDELHRAWWIFALGGILVLPLQHAMFGDTPVGILGPFLPSIVLIANGALEGILVRERDPSRFAMGVALPEGAS